MDNVNVVIHFGSHLLLELQVFFSDMLRINVESKKNRGQCKTYVQHCV